MTTPRAEPGWPPRGRWQPSRGERAEPPATEPAAFAPPAPQFGVPLLDRLRAIEGFDVDLALRYTGGQASVLERVLRRFVATYRQGLPTLLNVGTDEHEAILRWRAACHSARGALGLIGATQLIETVIGFERALNELAPLATLSATGRQVHDLLVAFVGEIAVELESRTGGKA